MKKIYFMALILFSSSIFAQTFNATTFVTQFDEQTVELNEQTKWVFFAASKDAFEILKGVFKQQKVDTKWLTERQAIYAADIHGMPSLIARFFALPKMRDYPYVIALDKEGDITDNWLNKGEQVTVYQLQNLKVIKVIKLADDVAVNKFFKSFK